MTKGIRNLVLNQEVEVDDIHAVMRDVRSNMDLANNIFLVLGLIGLRFAFFIMWLSFLANFRNALRIVGEITGGILHAAAAVAQTHLERTGSVADFSLINLKDGHLTHRNLAQAALRGRRAQDVLPVAGHRALQGHRGASSRCTWR